MPNRTRRQNARRMARRVNRRSIGIARHRPVSRNEAMHRIDGLRTIGVTGHAGRARIRGTAGANRADRRTSRAPVTCNRMEAETN
ncbi:hypothetical protein WS70_18065 [Burkholderia mayonis]|uniref:Uncharacterized protein n=1 Tax=Burkholderia mayonis TaxID=1385591 RepID=A0A1B4FJG0_9BURK|nr:hypothetical protein WS70_18065 [Burkholderia mayonis]KVE42550.1 hypothetical protein WS70_12130 [Burkholderia mayonis]KVE43486.1 hypothetical protein WS69_22450 [Burkholderia sp. BDU5]